MEILKSYDFGIRKPNGDCSKNLKDKYWKKFLKKWVYFYVDNECVFCKHIFKKERVYQVIYSGSDINGDGIYILYTANIIGKNDNFNVIPDLYDLVIGSFEEEDFLLKLKNEGFINKKEYDMFKTKDAKSIIKENNLSEIPFELL